MLDKLALLDNNRCDPHFKNNYPHIFILVSQPMIVKLI